MFIHPVFVYLPWLILAAVIVGTLFITSHADKDAAHLRKENRRLVKALDAIEGHEYRGQELPDPTEPGSALKYRDAERRPSTHKQVFIE